VAVFEYTATRNSNEAHAETGIMVAVDKIDAFDKLKRNGLRLIRLKRIEGFAAWIGRLTADIK
jgi:type II secretory pathway component PulF